MEKRAAIWALAVTQTLGYACLYYIFAALVVQWQDDLGWSKTMLALGPTCAIVVSGVLAPFLGRLIDKGWSRGLLTGGSALGAVALAVLAGTTTQTQYMIAWVMIGLAQASVLYEVCFAFLIRRLGGDARAAIIRVTLVAGFASTVAFPLAAIVSEAYGWRAVVWLAAVAVLGLQLPLNYWSVSVLRRGEVHATAQDEEAAKSALYLALRNLRFWLLGGVLAVLALNHWMMIAFIIPLFTDLGATMPIAVMAASFIGPAQVIGRLVLLKFDSTLDNWRLLSVCLGVMTLGIAALWMAGAAPYLIFVYACAQGAAMGIMTILRPVLVSDALGHTGYGVIAGSINVMPLMAGAAAPLVGGLMFGIGGAAALIWLSMALVFIGFIGALLLRRA